MKNKLLFSSVCTATAALVACGGGGGNNTQTIAPTHPLVTPSTLVTSVPAATYTGESATAYNLINAERSRCGFGLLAQNASLDAAANAHANYAFLPGQDLHAESPGVAGFTGVTPADRAVAKGYSSKLAVGEVMALGTGEFAIRALLSAPYHLAHMMYGYKDIGVGFGPLGQSPLLTPFVGELGDMSQKLASDETRTYPCEGTTGVNRQLRGEYPNPVPGRDLSSNPIGTPILVVARDGNRLDLLSASMINVKTGASIALRPLIGGMAANDPNRYFPPHAGYVAPDAPLERLSTYQVTIKGANNGVGFERTFQFSTGDGVN